MAVHFEIHHTTTYKYATPVTFGAHRAIFLPRPAIRGRLLSWSAKTNVPSKIRWVSDPLGNNITVFEFTEPGDELTFTLEFRGVHYGAKPVEEFPLEPRAEVVPVQHTSLASSCARTLRTTTRASPPGPKASSPTAKIERPISYKGCWLHFTAHLLTARGRLKARRRPERLCR